MGKAVKQAIIGGALIVAGVATGGAGFAVVGKLLVSAGMSGLSFKDAAGATWIARGARCEP